MSVIPFSDYLQIDAVNWSTLKELRRSPLHYRHRLENQRKDSPRLALGRAAHTAVFEPDRFMLEYACFKGPIRRGKKWDVFKESHAGETILKVDEYGLCLAMRDAVRRNPLAASYLERGAAEQSIRWTDPKTGLACKGRLDWVSDSRPALVDLKTTGDIEANRFGSWAARLGYHIQLAWYSDGLMYASGKRPPVVVIAVEAGPPHDVAVYRFDEDALYAGAEEYAALLRKVAECRMSGEWPGRYAEEQVLRLPRWMMDDEGDTALEDEISFGSSNGTSAEPSF